MHLWKDSWKKLVKNYKIFTLQFWKHFPRSLYCLKFMCYVSVVAPPAWRGYIFSRFVSIFECVGDRISNFHHVGFCFSKPGQCLNLRQVFAHQGMCIFQLSLFIIFSDIIICYFWILFLLEFQSGNSDPLRGILSKVSPE